VEVEVERITVLGADARVELVDGEGARVVARLRRDDVEDLDLEQGEILWAQLERERVFD
jgi:ABC-type molybdate transport system ATPase subunit